MEFIRVESESGVGAYQFPFICRIFGHHPVPGQDSKELLRKFCEMGDDAIFGFKSIQAFENWFSQELIDECIEKEEIDAELFVFFYEVEERIDGNYQSITDSTRPRITKKRIPLFEYYLQKELAQSLKV